MRKLNLKHRGDARRWESIIYTMRSYGYNPYDTLGHICWLRFPFALPSY